jgi:hypothetical protein
VIYSLFSDILSDEVSCVTSQMALANKYMDEDELVNEIEKLAHGRTPQNERS